MATLSSGVHGLSAFHPTPLVLYRHDSPDIGFDGEVDENFVSLGYYGASSGNLLSTFRNNVSAPSSRLKNS